MLQIKITMNILKECFHILFYQDINMFSSNLRNLAVIIYVLAFFILFLENGIIIASFLPGDTLLIFLGILISQGILNFPLTLCILTVGVSLGSWFSYLQGQWLKNSISTSKEFWLTYFPDRYRKLACQLFHSYGFFALFFGRFIFFVRTILPIVVVLSGCRGIRFHFFNWVSSFFWVFILTLFGFFLGRTGFIQEYEKPLVYWLIFFFIVIVLITVINYIKKMLLRINL